MHAQEAVRCSFPGAQAWSPFRPPVFPSCQRHWQSPASAWPTPASLHSHSRHRPARLQSIVAGTLARDKKAVVTNLEQLLQLSQPDGDWSAAPSDDSIDDAVPSSSQHQPTLAQPPAPLQPLPEPTDGETYRPSDGWKPRPHHLSKAQLWHRIRDEAALDAFFEPALATHLHSVILSHKSLEAAIAFILANKLADGVTLGSVQLVSLFRQVFVEDPEIMAAASADMHAVLDRDPACDKFTQCMLQFKGFQALQSYRITHHLWNKGRQALALAIQSRVSDLFQVDIHPGARIGRGVMLDHATGIVIGETCVVGDNVSMLHHVCLGGSGTGRGVRHPQIGHGVLLGSNACILGPIQIGPGTKVGAGSVVVTDLPDHCVAVGVPARIVKRNMREEPIKEMDMCTDVMLDYEI